MTKREKLLVTAYTGVMLVNIGDLCEYVSGLYNTEISPKDFTEEFWNDLKLKVSAEFGRLGEE